MRSRYLATAFLTFSTALSGAFASAGPARASTNPLDPSFGQGGVAIVPAPPTVYRWNGEIRGLAEDSQGRVVAAGIQVVGDEYALLRFLGDGSLDSSFEGGNLGGEGLVSTQFGFTAGAYDVAVQQDGGIISTGSLSPGQPSRTFGGFLLARYHEDGSLDSSLGGDGRVTTDLGANGGGAFTMGLQPDGRVVAGGFKGFYNGGSEGLVIAYRPNGAIDNHFGRHGQVAFQPGGRAQAAVNDVAVLPGSKILVAGYFRGRILLVRLRANGKLDQSFGGGDGRVLSDLDASRHCRCSYALALSVLPNSRILVVGNVATRAGGIALARYRANGRLDQSFGSNGVVHTRLRPDLIAEDMVTQIDGRIVVVGYSYQDAEPIFTVLRYLPDGRLDPSFGDGGIFRRQLGTQSVAYAALRLHDGRIAVGGSVNSGDHRQFLLTRFMADS